MWVALVYDQHLNFKIQARSGNRKAASLFSGLQHHERAVSKPSYFELKLYVPRDVFHHQVRLHQMSQEHQAESFLFLWSLKPR